LDFEHTAYIAFGSNLGNPKAQCQNALETLGRQGTCRVEEVSPLYWTEPVDFDDQQWFVNGVARIKTSLDPSSLLTLLKNLEHQAGRDQNAQRNGPRVLDLDILFYDDVAAVLPGLVLPHPRLHKRRFVLVPLCDIACSLIHPVFRKTVSGLLEDLSGDEKKVVPLTW